MKERRLDCIAVCVAAAMLAAAIYVGSYFALSEPLAYYHGNATVAYETRHQRFRFGGKAADVFFWPLTQIDRLIRPGFWSEEHRAPFSGEPSYDPFAVDPI